MARKKKNKKWIIWVLLAAVVGVVVLGLINKNSGDKPTEVFTSEVVTRTIYETVGASGKIYPIVEVKISSDVSGEIVALYIEEGDSVKSGQLLAKIDPDAFESQVERAEAAVNNTKANASMSEAGLQTSYAQLEQVKASYENVRQIHARNDKLFAGGVISQADFDASIANLKSAEANVRSAEASVESSKKSIEAGQYSIKSAQASLKEIRTSLRRTTITAPMSGIISDLSVELGERVVGTIQMSGTELMRIANLNAMEVQVDVSENDILRVSLGDSVEIEVDAYFDKSFYGEVTQIANSASNAGAIATDQVTNFTVTVQIEPNSYHDLIEEGRKYPFRPGMSANVEIYTTKEENIIAVPIQAVATREKVKKKKDSDKKDNGEEDEIDYDNLNEVVFVINSDTAEMVIVKTGIQDDEYIHVKEGLEKGQVVITGPYSLVSKNLKVGESVTEKEDKDSKDKKDN